VPVSITIRRAGVADAHWLAELAERTFRDTFSASNTPEDMAHYVAEHFGTARQAAELADSSFTTLLAEADGRPAGYVQLVRGAPPPGVRGPEPLEIHRFYVDRPWHGRGVAQDLMRAADAAARADGARTLWLGVWERNSRAIAFYRKCGFQDAGAQTFVLGSDHQRDLVLARSLD
jgi:ribosomal protein S18 acetylase RimI-like enzyme